MKKLSLLLALTMLLTLTACKPKTQDPEPLTPEDSMEKTVLHLEELAVEFPRSGLSKDQLTQAVKGLPELFKTYFHETGIVEAEHVTVTVGSFPSATAQALTEGGVDVAFLPGTTAAALDGPVVLLADARLLDDGATLRSGTRALLCAAPTAYGNQLVGRASSGKPLSHTETERARWGMVETGAARDCFTLWLADSFGEEQAFDWSAVTMYGSEEELFWAAANGEIDALVIRDDARTGAAESWAGEGSIWEQLPVLDVTETVYTTVTAVNPELAEGDFPQALEQVLQRMSGEHPELMTVLGADDFAPVTVDGLAATRRLEALTAE